MTCIQALREIHVELEDLNAEAATLAATIKNNFEELGGYEVENQET